MSVTGQGSRIGVIGGPGDRRDEDFITLGKLSAEIFDRIIVKEDDDTRGRPRGQAAELIVEGIVQAKPECRYEAILDETQAINTALDSASSGSLVVFLPESVSRALSLIQERHPLDEVGPVESTGAAVESQVSVQSSISNQL